MALASLNFESQYLKCNTEIRIILPDKKRNIDAKAFYQRSIKYPVLWLLHGGLGDCTDWLRKSNIEVYACEHDLAVVMPCAYNSIYSNWPEYGQGLNMYDFFFGELMPLIYAWFPVSDERKDNFIAGLSMGGKGTLKFALTHPEKFAAAAVLSSAPIRIEQRLDKEEKNGKYNWTNMVKKYGGLKNFKNSNDELYHVMDGIIHNGKTGDLPRIYNIIGSNDRGIDNWRFYKSYCEKNNLPFKFEMIDGYEHEWRFWDIAIQKAMEFFGFCFELKVNERKGNPF